MARIKKKIKTISVDADKCNGCRACEVACSSFHAIPRYSSNNPARSRIQVITYRLKDIWLPVFAGEYTPAECMGRDRYVIDGKEYDQCGFCRAACPSRDLFKEPDSGLPLRCDMCEENEPGEKPLCVQVCLNDVLIYEEREEEVEEGADEETTPDEALIGLKSLVDKYGFDNLVSTLSRMTQKA